MKKGFTIVELMAIVVILAMIAIISTPIIMSTLNRSKKKTYEATCSSVERAARLYMTNELDNKIAIGEVIEIDTKLLKPYLSSTNLVQWDYVVRVTRTSDETTYYYTGREVPLNIVYKKN